MLSPYVKAIHVETLQLNKNVEMYLHNTNFYFKGLISLQLYGLETFEPLQFIEFEKLEYLTFSGQPYYNFRSLKKLMINQSNEGIKRITILLNHEKG